MGIFFEMQKEEYFNVCVYEENVWARFKGFYPISFPVIPLSQEQDCYKVLRNAVTMLFAF